MQTKAELNKHTLFFKFEAILHLDALVTEAVDDASTASLLVLCDFNAFVLSFRSRVPVPTIGKSLGEVWDTLADVKESKLNCQACTCSEF